MVRFESERLHPRHSPGGLGSTDVLVLVHADLHLPRDDSRAVPLSPEDKSRWRTP